MRACTGVVVGVLALLMVLSQVTGQNTESIVTLVLQKLGGLWHNGEVDFMGHSCMYNYRPTISRWKLYYKGKMWCPGWAPFSGRSRKKSRSGAIEHATRDFVQKALDSGLITKEDASAWISQ
ncbi:anti-lipopolysaccharide factor-like [Homarus americanus]|uniref:Anti-lipopolysaccharide factor-like 5 n=1 Tax=Homarus americanus TaxID=6706 RepID=A0A8J5N5R2_HOMAM|nr:anti-lipopolysaccharide factor-like [Homarus americanus]KAG7173664.1 anti-lipopolysaccharide factor-like 5 [Homarus americanus]